MHWRGWGSPRSNVQVCDCGLRGMGTAMHIGLFCPLYIRESTKAERVRQEPPSQLQPTNGRLVTTIPSSPLNSWEGQAPSFECMRAQSDDRLRGKGLALRERDGGVQRGEVRAPIYHNGAQAPEERKGYWFPWERRCNSLKNPPLEKVTA